MAILELGELKMNERDKETIKLGATLFANIAAIGVGVAMFENKPGLLGLAIILPCLPFYTIRRKRLMLTYILIVAFGLAIFGYVQYVARQAKA